MIYGANFGAPNIPAHLLKRVRLRRYKGIPVAKGTVAVLVGCCNTTVDKARMNVQADNGKRGLFWQTVEIKRGLDVGFWHFVWVYTPEFESVPECAPASRHVAPWLRYLR